MIGDNRIGDNMKKILKFGFCYINKYKNLYIAYLFTCLFCSLLNICLPWLIGLIINVITKNQGMEILLKRVLLFLFLSLLLQILSFIANHISLKLQAVAGYTSNMEVIKKIYGSSYLNILYEDPAMLNQKINNDCNVVVMFCVSFFKDIISNVASVVFIAAILIYQSKLLSVILLGLVGLYVIIYIIFRKPLYKANYDVKQSQTTFFGKLYSIVSHIKSIRNNGFQSVILKQQDDIFHNYYHSLYKQFVVSNQFNIITSLISLVSQIILFIYGGYLVLEQKMSLGIFVVISNYFSSLIQTTNYFLNFGENYQNVKTSFDRVIEYFNLPQIHYGNKKLKSVSKIKFEHVSFAYPDKSALFSFHRSFEKGTIYWIQGKNGIGKTTLIYLLMGLFGNDYNGKILFDGLSSKEIDYLDLIQNRISIVEQQPFLLSDSFKTNMLCKCNSDFNEMELNKLIHEFGMNEFFEKQLNGMHAVYNFLNDTISGGEKQKLAIIRLLLSNADIWILDEPTSALDQQSCINFYSIIKEKKKNHIIIIISHDEPLEFDEIVKMSDYNKI